MKLHENSELFRQAVQSVSNSMNMDPIYIEKDYWVTYILRYLFESDIASEIVFKGGTSLSKTEKFIERFSEDIDIVMIRRNGESDNRLKSKIRFVSSLVAGLLPEYPVERITSKKGMTRKTAHVYNQQFSGTFDSIMDVIVLEVTWLGSHEPFYTKDICSFLGQAFMQVGKLEFASVYGLLPFPVRVLATERTICEKIMSLIRFSYSENPINELKRKVRHLYDIHQLLKQPDYQKFFDSDQLDLLLCRVARDDVSSFKNNNLWLYKHPAESLLFNKADEVWPILSVAYNYQFRNLVYGELPDASAVYETIKNLERRLRRIIWDI